MESEEKQSPGVLDYSSGAELAVPKLSYQAKRTIWKLTLIGMILVLGYFAVPVSWEEVAHHQRCMVILKEVWVYGLVGSALAGWWMIFWTGVVISKNGQLSRGRVVRILMALVLPVLLLVMSFHFLGEWRPLKDIKGDDGKAHRKIGRSFFLSHDEAMTHVEFGIFYDKHILEGKVLAD